MSQKDVEQQKVWHILQGGEIRNTHEGTVRWILNGNLHREGGPAIEYIDGTYMWYLNGKLHRENGPAIEWAHGYKEWWLDGVSIRVGRKVSKNERIR